MRRTLPLLIFLAIVFSVAKNIAAQTSPFPSPEFPAIYDRLSQKIERIPIYDNHSHPGFADDSDVDAMASPPGESNVLRLRDDNPEFVTAAKVLFGYPYDDFKSEHAKWLADKKKAAEAKGDSSYFNGILDKLNFDICLANRAFMAS